MSIAVAIVEDDPEIRQSLAELIGEAPGFRCAGTYGTAEEALRQLPAQPPDVVLMDINLPRLSGVECVRRLKATMPKLPIVMLTAYQDSEKIFTALQAGASGYLLKRTPPEKILESIIEVHQGGSPMSPDIARQVVHSFHQLRKASPALAQLTAREEELLRLVAQGEHNKQIGVRLGISTETVRTHLRNIYEKLHVGSRSEAVAKFLKPDRPPSLP